MNIERILADLRTERQRIDSAIAALESLDGSTARRGRPAATTTASPVRRRRMSAAARKRISLAQKARWAKQRRKAA